MTGRRPQIKSNAKLIAMNEHGRTIHTILLVRPENFLALRRNIASVVLFCGVLGSLLSIDYQPPFVR
jgi:hypothetical protein